MEDIPNKTVNYLGIVEDVNLLTEGELYYIEIVVAPSNMPVVYRGVYHYRSGSTKQELKGIALQQFIMKKMGRSWDGIPLETASIADIDRKAIDYFLHRGISAGRMAEYELESSTEDVLSNLGLITLEVKLKTAAILLFGKHVRQFFLLLTLRLDVYILARVTLSRKILLRATSCRRPSSRYRFF